ncbi:MAG: Rpn family recombination-promoting nuclease/putative transposase [Desulfovibrio sp.]|nr:Rpn family recombination-promoting nuclease/putative transposase [Desulfovibrio sp.]
MRDFVPKELIGEFDLRTLESRAGEYTTLNLQTRQDDIVWRVRFKDVWCYVYIILEYQNHPDPWMGLRILTYTALLWEELVKKGEIKTGERLPPIFPWFLTMAKRHGQRRRKSAIC